MSQEVDKALKQARATADRVQMRIIEAKIAEGKKLFPDEEELLERLRPSAPEKKQELLMEKFARILELAKHLEAYYREKNIEGAFNKKAAFNSMDAGEITITGMESLSPSERIIAFHLSNKGLTEEEALSRFIREAKKD